VLQSLHIENAAVIQSADMDLEKGFMVLSGETGAGKSIIVDSIHLLSGSRLSRDMIRTGEDRMLVSAIFADCREEVVALLDSYGILCDGSVMLVRTLSRDGKSTVKINGRTVTQSLQRELCKLLINIHGQHDNQRLMQRAAQIEILDAYAENRETLAAYSKVYRELLDLRARLAELDGNTAEKLRMRDMLKYQIEEIAAARLKEGEEEALEAESKRLSAMERIHAQTHLAYRALHGSEKSATVLLERAASALSKLADVLPEAADEAKRLEEMYELNKEVKVLLNDVNAHYSADNIAKRDSWMQWVNDRAVTYDTFIKEMGDKFADVVKVLEEVFVQNSRDRIIDFATKVSDEKAMVSREEFNRIFKVHKKYEDFLEERNLTNGEVDIAYRIIADSYEGHMRNHTFVEDIRGYNE